jgi:hypothetical protein
VPKNIGGFSMMFRDVFDDVWWFSVRFKYDTIYSFCSFPNGFVICHQHLPCRTEQGDSFVPSRPRFGDEFSWPTGWEWRYARTLAEYDALEALRSRSKVLASTVVDVVLFGLAAMVCKLGGSVDVVELSRKILSSLNQKYPTGSCWIWTPPHSGTVTKGLPKWRRPLASEAGCKSPT